MGYKGEVSDWAGREGGVCRFLVNSLIPASTSVRKSRGLYPTQQSSHNPVSLANSTSYRRACSWIAPILLSSLICMSRSEVGALIRWDRREASNAPISVAHRPLSAELPLAEPAFVQVSVGVFAGAHAVLTQVDAVQYVVVREKG